MFGMFFKFDYRKTLCLSCCLKYSMFLFGGGAGEGGGEEIISLPGNTWSLDFFLLICVKNVNL